MLDPALVKVESVTLAAWTIWTAGDAIKQPKVAVMHVFVAVASSFAAFLSRMKAKFRDQIAEPVDGTHLDP